jgi:hypothetical protein
MRVFAAPEGAAARAVLKSELDGEGGGTAALRYTRRGLGDLFIRRKRNRADGVGRRDYEVRSTGQSDLQRRETAANGTMRPWLSRFRVFRRGALRSRLVAGRHGGKPKLSLTKQQCRL